MVTRRSGHQQTSPRKHLSSQLARRRLKRPSRLTNTAAPTIHERVEAVGIAGAGLMVSAPVICPSSFASVSVNLVTYRRPPPRPPPPRPPPPREKPPPLEPPPRLTAPLREPLDRMLDEPRELLARAPDPLNPPEPPPNAPGLEPPRERSRPEMLLPPLGRLLRPPWLGRVLRPPWPARLPRLPWLGS